MLSLSTFQHKFPIILPLHPPPKKKGICFATSLKTSHFWCVFGIITILSPKGTGSVRLLSVGILTGAGDCMTSGTALGFESTLEGNTGGHTMHHELLPSASPICSQIEENIRWEEAGSRQVGPTLAPTFPPERLILSGLPRTSKHDWKRGRVSSHHCADEDSEGLAQGPPAVRGSTQVSRPRPWALFLIPHSHNVSDFLWCKDPIATRSWLSWTYYTLIHFTLEFYSILLQSLVRQAAINSFSFDWITWNRNFRDSGIWCKAENYRMLSFHFVSYLKLWSNLTLQLKYQNNHNEKDGLSRCHMTFLWLKSLQCPRP